MCFLLYPVLRTSIMFFSPFPRLACTFPCGFLSLVMGCSSLPENLMQTLDKVVTRKLPRVEVNTVPDAGDVRLGSVIAKVTNLQDKTRVEVVNVPSFEAAVNEYWCRTKGRLSLHWWTCWAIEFCWRSFSHFGGHIEWHEDGTIGDYPCTFPVMNVYNQRLWRSTERVVVNSFAPTYYSCHSLHCRSFQTMPRQGRVIKDVE